MSEVKQDYDHDAMKKLAVILGTPFLLLLVLLGAYLFAGSQRAPLSKPPEHGVCFTLEAEPTAQGTNGIAELKEALQKRFAQFGARTFCEPVSKTTFRVYAPIQAQRAVEAASGLISKRGILEFRLVHPEKPELLSVPEGYEVMQVKTHTAVGAEEYTQRYLVSKTAEGGPAGIKVRQAMATQNSRSGTYDIAFKLMPDSAEAFRKLTQENVGRQLAIVMDGVLLSAPVIRSEIPGGAGVISANYDRVMAIELATLLETPLPFEVRLLETKSF